MIAETPWAALLRKAVTPEDVFGKNLVGDAYDKHDAIKAKFHELSLYLHPDRPGGSEDLFKKLTGFRTEADQRVKAGVYGTAAPISAKLAYPIVVTKGPSKYVLSRLLKTGDISLVHLGSHGPDDSSVVLKVASASADNDLVANEATALKKLLPKGTTDTGFYRYLPRVLDSFRVPGRDGPRQVNVLPYYEGYVSLAEIREAYPRGLAIEHLVWIFNRLLEGLGFVHSKGLVHGAILPEHILVHPKTHGCRIIDWSYSVEAQGKVGAISKARRTLYAPEILVKDPASSETDVYMAATSLQTLVGPNVVVPGYFQGLINGCLFAQQKKRPDAWGLRADVDDVMHRSYGRRQYHELPMP